MMFLESLILGGYFFNLFIALVYSKFVFSSSLGLRLILGVEGSIRPFTVHLSAHF